MTRAQILRRLAKTLEHEADRVDAKLARMNGRAWIIINQAVGVLRNLADEMEAPKRP